MHLEVLWRFKGHQVREELQQKHQGFFTVGMVAAASAERHLKQPKTKTETNRNARFHVLYN